MSVEISIGTARRYILVINGFWLEDGALARDDGFAEALGRGMSRFAGFLGAGRVDAGAVPQPKLRKRLAVRRSASGR